MLICMVLRLAGRPAPTKFLFPRHFPTTSGNAIFLVKPETLLSCRTLQNPKLTEWQSTPFFTASFLPIIPGTRDFLKSDRLPPTHRILWISMKHHHTPFYMCTIRTGLSLWELHTLMFTVMRLVIITPCTLHLFSLSSGSTGNINFSTQSGHRKYFSIIRNACNTSIHF